ncbi:MAG: amidohydrolase family protein [bacterium]|nr:amidohydrolase family protein [bacterium]
MKFRFWICLCLCTWVAWRFELAAQSLLSENFDGFVGDFTIDISANLDAYTQVPGWTGEKIFPSNQTAKLGSSSARGVITTPTLDLSAGPAVLSFDARWWSASDATKIQILHAPNGSSFSQVGPDIQLSASFTRYTLEITGGSPASKLRIQAATAANERFFLDNLEIAQSTSPDDPNLVMPSSLTFGLIPPGFVATQSFVLANSGLSNTLVIATVLPTSGDTSVFSLLDMPVAIPAGSSTLAQAVYAPGFLTGATHTAAFLVLCNDPSNPTNSLTLSGATSRGPVTVSNIQFTSSPSGVSPLSNELVDVTAIVTYVDGRGYVISDPQGGPWSGIYVFDNIHRPEIGDQIRLTGRVVEYYNLTEIDSVSSFALLSKSNTVPALQLPANLVAQEQYEGVLVCLSNLTVSNNRFGTNEWQVQNSSGTCLVNHDPYRVLYRYIPRVGAYLTALSGVVWQVGSTYKIQVRNDDDFVGRPVNNYALFGIAITPDGPRSNFYVHIVDDDIVAVTDAPPPGVLVVATDGLIFPGLLDVHNHIAWNSFPTLMFNNFPYGHRDEWGEYDPEYDAWRNKRSQVTGHPRVLESQKKTISKYGELLELMAGCVTVQGESAPTSPEINHPVVMLYNIEQFPSRIYANIFPWRMDSAAAANLKQRLEGGAINATLIHLCEGPDATSLAQFYTWKSLGLLTNATAIIHGTSLTSNELAQLAAVGGKLLWSPMSNMKLYEATANAALAHRLGVVVGLSPDWTPSGAANILEELGYAWYLNTTLFSNYFSPRQMIDMVTVNNAIACGLADRYGKLAPGYNAGIAVVRTVTNDPYLSLIHARPKDILLTIVDGTPRYGDPSLLQALGVTGEVVSIHGMPKMFNIAVDHPFLSYATDTVANVLANLRTAHASLSPSGELEPDELQFLDLHLLQLGPDHVPPFRAENPIAAPPAGAQLTVGIPSELRFRRQDFWDNETDSRSLIHAQIAIVPQPQPATLFQIIATNVLNYTPASNKEVIVSFVPNFVAFNTNCLFRFITLDRFRNARTTLVSAVTFTVVPEPLGGFLSLAVVCYIYHRTIRSRLTL